MFFNQRFHLMAKPSSYHCNIQCEYCFYLEKEKFMQKKQQDAPPSRKRDYMNTEVLKAYIRDYIAANQTPEVNFAWQGGEPTLLGLDFYREAVKWQRHYANGKTITNSLQTNGIMLNDAWGEFFHQEQFLIGISIDGLAAVHDHYRVFNNQAPTYGRVVKAVELLQRHQVEFNSLTVINDKNWDKGEQTYEALKALGIQYMQFIPIVEYPHPAKERSYPQKTRDFSVPPHGYGEFLLSIFDCWIRQDVGKIFVNAFDDLLAQWLGYGASSCIHAEVCGNALVIEANGDLYSCDHFVYPNYRLGNLLQTPLPELVQSKAQYDFGMAKKTTLTQACQQCDVRHFCHGGCPKDRIVKHDEETYLHNYLCPSYKAFYRRTAAMMHQMSMLLRQGRPASDIMPMMVNAPLVSKPSPSTYS